MIMMLIQVARSHLLLTRERDINRYIIQAVFMVRLVRGFDRDTATCDMFRKLF